MLPALGLMCYRCCTEVWRWQEVPSIKVNRLFKNLKNHFLSSPSPISIPPLAPTPSYFSGQQGSLEFEGKKANSRGIISFGVRSMLPYSEARKDWIVIICCSWSSLVSSHLFESQRGENPYSWLISVSLLKSEPRPLGPVTDCDHQAHFPPSLLTPWGSLRKPTEWCHEWNLLLLLSAWEPQISC